MDVREEAFDRIYKITLLGDEGVGKSSLLLRYTTGHFSDNPTATVGIDFKVITKKFGEDVVKLQFWDTAGQERYRSFSSSYTRGSSGVILVYDPTQNTSFSNIETWMKFVGENGQPNAVTILVANKDDLIKGKIVTEIQGKKLAEQYGIKFYMVSAKTGQGVTEIFEDIVDEIETRYKLQQEKTTLHSSIILNKYSPKSSECC